ncbi:MAG: DUF2849 domain-containing protein [Rhizobiaceae bacterium]|jgi:hypothetical protein|nr:DUF2849 domain-containing protein [Rhizobiaceae bacterium]
MKTLPLKVLTANRLCDGIAVWLGRGGLWVEHVEEAWAAATPEAITQLEDVAAATLAKAQHCDVNLIDVEDTAQGLRPLKLRERIRAQGPTIRLDLGKQAEREARAA